MQLDMITFEHFMIEVKNDIVKEHLVFINPNVMKFFKVGNVYLALSVPNNKIVVNFAINTGKRFVGDWAEILKKEARQHKYEGVIFHTSVKNTVVQNIAKKNGCVIIDTLKDFYLNGEDCLVFEWKVI